MRFSKYSLKYTENINYKSRPLSLSELTPIIFQIELIHLGSETYKYHILYNGMEVSKPEWVNPIINTGLTHLGS